MKGTLTACLFALLAVPACETEEETQTPPEATKPVEQVETLQKESKQAYESAQEAQQKAIEEQQQVAGAREEVRTAEQELAEAQQKAERERQEARQAQQQARQEAQQAEQEAQQARQRAEQLQQEMPKAGATTGSATETQTATGRIQQSGAEEILIQRDDGQTVRVRVDSSTTIEAGGQQASASALQPGATVTVHYRTEDGEPVAERLEVSER